MIKSHNLIIEIAIVYTFLQWTRTNIWRTHKPVSYNSLIDGCGCWYDLTGVITILDIAYIDHLHRTSGRRGISHSEITYNTAYILALIRLHDRAWIVAVSQLRTIGIPYESSGICIIVSAIWTAKRSPLCRNRRRIKRFWDPGWKRITDKSAKTCISYFIGYNTCYLTFRDLTGESFSDNSATHYTRHHSRGSVNRYVCPYIACRYGCAMGISWNSASTSFRHYITGERTSGNRTAKSLSDNTSSDLSVAIHNARCNCNITYVGITCAGKDSHIVSCSRYTRFVKYYVINSWSFPEHTEKSCVTETFPVC